MTAAAAPSITVVTVVKNAVAELPRCLESVSRQRYPRLEHLVVDGASTDGTAELLRRAAGGRLRFVSEPDQGIYDAMNKAVDLATGDFLLFLGADDLLRADLLEVAPLLSDPLAVYYGDAWLVGASRRYDGPFDGRKLAYQNICHQAIFYPRAVFERHRFDLRYRVLADWELNMRCFSDPALRLEWLPVVVADYEDRRGVSIQERDLALERDYLRLVWRHFPWWVALPRSTLRLAAQALRALGLGRLIPR
ncbi:MAG: glycosyltransferase [Anaeromyxobacteraceae bacterium]|nr:glycosyltransferase [Anaeromyxobacteraceae bacterium]